MYNLSTDYERMYDLIEKGDHPLYTLDEYEFTPWITPLEGESKESIIQRFTKANLRWIDPQPVAGIPDIFSELVDLLIRVSNRKPDEFSINDLRRIETAVHISHDCPTYPVLTSEQLSMLQKDNFAAGQAYIIEQLKGLQRFHVEQKDGRGFWGWEAVNIIDIEAIINQTEKP